MRSRYLTRITVVQIPCTVWWGDDMKLLVVGGTWFLGRALVEEALLRGHKVTAFNRGSPSNEAHAAHFVVHRFVWRSHSRRAPL